MEEPPSASVPHFNHKDSCVCKKLTAALDRQHEAHWHLHQLDAHYHQADPFRYSLNSFLRVLKEVPQIVRMQLQGVTGFKAWFEQESGALTSDPIFLKFSKHRDFIVHQGMLVPRSFVHVGTTRDGRTFKIGIPFSASVLEDSEEIMARFVAACGSDDFLYGVAVAHGDESQFPCVYRKWFLSSFPDDEARTVAVRAWKRVGAMLSATLTWLGHEPTSYATHPCLPRHEDPATMFQVYEQSIFDDVIRARGDGDGT